MNLKKALSTTAITAALALGLIGTTAAPTQAREATVVKGNCADADTCWTVPGPRFNGGKAMVYVDVNNGRGGTATWDVWVGDTSVCHGTLPEAGGGRTFACDGLPAGEIALSSGSWPHSAHDVALHCNY